jgi:hypothetical protein
VSRRPADGTPPVWHERYRTDDDGTAFRRRAFTYFGRRYCPTILKAVDVLNTVEFHFPESGKAHSEQVREELVFRHCLPFCATEEAWFPDEAPAVAALAVLLAGHTLALTHLDHHLDGVQPDPSSPVTAPVMRWSTAIGYSIRMVHSAGRLAEAGGAAGRMFTEVLDPYSGFVVERMCADFGERFDPRWLEEPARRLRDYLGSPRSRLLGSGYWDVMVRGAFVSHGAVVPRPLAITVRRLRKLRQLVDEIADFDDDLTAGLATTPLLFALNAPGADDLAAEVRGLWVRRDADAVAGIRKRVLDAGGFDATARVADALWQRTVDFGARTLGPRADGIVVLLDLKRAKLAALAANDWHNRPTEDRFMPS